MRKPTILVTVAAAIFVLGSSVVPATASQPQWKDLLNQITHKSSKTNALPSSEVASGLKEALANGVTNAVNSLGRKGGFWDNAKVRIPLPDKLQQVAKLARMAGQGAKVDAFQLSLNRAAEKAVPQVADILGDAVRHMNIRDAQKILTGGDHAATDYFRRVAGKALFQRIEPIVGKATDSVGVTRKYKALVNGSNGQELGGLLAQLGGKSGKNAGNSLNLDDYVTNKAIAGLFTMIGQEEKDIREHPAARTTELLKKVFAGH